MKLRAVGMLFLKDMLYVKQPEFYKRENKFTEDIGVAFSRQGGFLLEKSSWGKGSGFCGKGRFGCKKGYSGVLGYK